MVKKQQYQALKKQYNFIRRNKRMNKFIGAGRLTRDVEVREVGETKVAKFGIAVNRRFKKDGQPDADFINCVAFGKTAENIGNFFKKGSMICLSGRIQTGSYDKEDGTKVYTTDVVVEEFSFVESKKDSASNNDDDVVDLDF
jgi:single-strand DNA-binding protein